MTKSPTWLNFAHTTKPDIKLLKRILNSDDYNYYTTNQIKAVRLKYQALIAEPTIIEKTMSPEQLFNARTHYGQADIPFKNCMIGSNIANHLMAMIEWMRLSE